MTKKKKIILSISSVLLVLILYGWFFGFQTLFLLGLNDLRKDPLLNLVPRPMAVRDCSAPATDVEAFDFSFSIPWADLSEVYSSTSFVAWTAFESNIVITCFAPQENLYSTMVDPEGWGEEDRSTHQGFVRALGLEDATDTNYYLCSKMWNATPRDVSIFSSRADVVINALLLMGKGIAVPTNLSSVYSFEEEHVKGFQMGTLPDDQQAFLTLFDRLDREVKIVVAVRTNLPVSITQADINTIITTFSVEP